MKAVNYEKHAEIFKSLGHPTRLMLAHKLKKKELCVCELNEFVDIDQSTLSRHLKVLKDAGVLKSEKKSMQVFYSLRVPCLLDNVLECIEDL
ncbi:MAG: winged helix-turn-helix transcriptional regulator [Bdellovibrionaceae bacterium]|jgi:DNA-binding transcriptional ArsR family regulator|nr:winged helix-turn-helix transcriptional regulator [Pseudobdellovibrionaceae bacterium]